MASRISISWTPTLSAAPCTTSADVGTGPGARGRRSTSACPPCKPSQILNAGLDTPKVLYLLCCTTRNREDFPYQESGSIHVNHHATQSASSRSGRHRPGSDSAAVRVCGGGGAPRVGRLGHNAPPPGRIRRAEGGQQRDPEEVRGDAGG